MPDTEKLSWDEIRKRYPDEWVILLDVDGDDLEPEIRAGVVYKHCKHRDQLLVGTKEALAGKSRTILYTGEVGMGNYRF
jgi:hypothetical protein